MRAQNVSDPQFSNFVNPPLINDRSLKIMRKKNIHKDGVMSRLHMVNDTHTRPQTPRQGLYSKVAPALKIFQEKYLLHILVGDKTT